MKISFFKRIKYLIEHGFIMLTVAGIKLFDLEKNVRFYTWLCRRYGEKLLKNARIARQNMKKTFPEKSEAEIQKLMDDMWECLIRVPIEYNRPDLFLKGEGSDRIQVEGIENLHAMMNDDKPGIIVTGHYGNWQMITFVAQALGYPIYQLYRPSNNIYFDRHERRCQEVATAGVLTKGKKGAKDMIDLLKRKQHILLLMDQRFGSGPKIPFLGRPATTATGPIRLALKNDAVILPAKSERIGNSTHFKVTYYPPLKYETTGDVNKDAETIMGRVNDILSGWIREKPEQWMWIHNRWKSSEI